MGIVVIALLLFSFIYNSSQPDSKESLNVITDNGSVNHSSSYPFTAVVKYNGTWYSKMGDPNYLVEQSGSGAKVIFWIAPHGKEYQSQLKKKMQVTVRLQSNF